MFDSSSNRKTNKKKDKEGWSWFKKPEYQEPKSMVAIWTEDVFIQPGKPVTRGFGGRIYFYNEKSQAIPVDGELMVYGFDDSGATKPVGASPSDQEMEQAGKKFRFTAEQFTQHFAHSELGASYSVWIPWDAAGGEQKKIMLMPTFITKDQRIVRGEAARLALSGKPSGLASSKVPNNTIQLASATVPTVPSNSLLQLNGSQPLQNMDAFTPNVPLGINTTTIRMEQPIQRSFAGNTLASNFPMQVSNQQYPIQSNAMQNNQLPAAAASMPLQYSPQTQPNSMQPSVPSNANTKGLPALGHGLPTTGWIQQGQAPLVPPAVSNGNQSSQFPAQGLPISQ
jgi:hypothetical protein